MTSDDRFAQLSHALETVCTGLVADGVDHGDIVDALLAQAGALLVASQGRDLASRYLTTVAARIAAQEVPHARH